jgi:hypothetical protein
MMLHPGNEDLVARAEALMLNHPRNEIQRFGRAPAEGDFAWLGGVQERRKLRARAFERSRRFVA